MCVCACACVVSCDMYVVSHDVCAGVRYFPGFQINSDH